RAVESEEPERAGFGEARAERDPDDDGGQHERDRYEGPHEPPAGEAPSVQHIRPGDPQQHGGGRAGRRLAEGEADDPPGALPGEYIGEPAEVEAILADEAEPDERRDGQGEEGREEGERKRPRGGPCRGGEAPAASR